MGQHEGTTQIENDDNSKKTKIILTRFRLTFGTLMFDEKSIFNRLLGFEPYWDYKTNNEYMLIPQVYTPVKNL